MTKYNVHVVCITCMFGFYWFTLLHKIKYIKKLFFHEDKWTQRGRYSGSTVRVRVLGMIYGQMDTKTDTL